MVFGFVNVMALSFIIWAFIIAGGKGKLLLLFTAAFLFIALPHNLTGPGADYGLFAGKVILGIGCLIYIKWEGYLPGR